MVDRTASGRAWLDEEDEDDAPSRSRISEQAFSILTAALPSDDASTLSHDARRSDTDSCHVVVAVVEREGSCGVSDPMVVVRCPSCELPLFVYYFGVFALSFSS